MLSVIDQVPGRLSDHSHGSDSRSDTSLGMPNDPAIHIRYPERRQDQSLLTRFTDLPAPNDIAFPVHQSTQHDPSVVRHNPSSFTSETSSRRHRSTRWGDPVRETHPNYPADSLRNHVRPVHLDNAASLSRRLSDERPLDQVAYPPHGTSEPARIKHA
ncbi:hypothetical protein B0H34DRAFT_477284 [Crassisporium funariophilum]|nr:hypothetical protein B0H34DRAFT_477284 [Crassisporium funariophilum]